MGQLKQSATWWPVTKIDLPLPDALARLKQIGYAAVEFVPRDQFEMVRDAGLTISAMGGHGTLTDGLNRPENHDRIEREIKDNIQLAAEWKIPNLICFSGNRSGISDDEGAKNTAAGFARVAGWAEAANVTLVMELLNSNVDHADYQCDRTEWGAQVCRRVESPAVKLLYDIYHMQIMEGDLIRTIRDNIAWIGHFHTAGNPGRHEIGEDQEIYYPAVCQAIRATDYNGYLAHEFGPTRDALESLTEAYRVCAAAS